MHCVFILLLLLFVVLFWVWLELVRWFDCCLVLLCCCLVGGYSLRAVCYLVGCCCGLALVVRCGQVAVGWLRMVVFLLVVLLSLGCVGLVLVI